MFSTINSFSMTKRYAWVVAFLALSFSMLSAQNCLPPTGLTKDSTTATNVYFSWQPVSSSVGYQVAYRTNFGVNTKTALGTSTSFTFTPGTTFEVLTIRSMCAGGGMSEGATLMLAGIVVTIDDVFSIYDGGGGCGIPEPYGEELFFIDLCRHISFSGFYAITTETTVLFGCPFMEETDAYFWLNYVKNRLILEGEEFDGYGCGERLEGPGIGELELSPNPFSHTFTLSYHLESAGQVQINVFDILGRRVESHQMDIRSAGAQRHTQLGANLPQGMYSVHIQYGKQQQTISVIKN